jgi:predicted O-methyltransferase YrrM
MKKLFLIRQYLVYLLKAKNAHGVHSPFVFEFVNEVLKDHRHFYAFDEIKRLREEMYHNQTLLNVEDFGAGSHKQNLKQRKVCDIASTAGRNEKFGKLLFKIVNNYKPRQIVELGTSMGLGTAYIALAHQEAQVNTIEGSREIAAQAAKHFAQLKLHNIVQHTGNFDAVLTDILKGIGQVDLLFVDGNHRMKPTLQYFNEAKPFLHPQSIVIFDDIHWSEEMHAAWQIIKDDPMVTLSLDLFYFGIVFFQKEFKVKQNFVLSY